jgi:hypothetical protein
MSQASNGSRSALVATIIAGWLMLAIAMGASGVLATIQPPVPQIILLVITVVALAAAFGIGAIRRWTETVDVRVLTALHLSRFVGIYFLVLSGRGELPADWAVRAGWGDIVVAVLAAVLLLTGAPTTQRRWQAYRLWNYVGALDIALVVITAARTTMRAPTSMHALQVLPLNLLNTVLGPLIIVSHVLLTKRLFATGPEKLDSQYAVL